MSLLNSVLKVFVGDKSKQDVKAIMPVVNKIKTFENATINRNFGLEQTLKSFKKLQKHIPASGVNQGHITVLNLLHYREVSILSYPFFK